MYEPAGAVVSAFIWQRDVKLHSCTRNATSVHVSKLMFSLYKTNREANNKLTTQGKQKNTLQF